MTALPFNYQTSFSILLLSLVHYVLVSLWLTLTRCTQNVKWNTSLTTQALKPLLFWLTWQIKLKKWRSEERRVGKECRSGWGRERIKRKRAKIEGEKSSR